MLVSSSLRPWHSMLVSSMLIASSTGSLNHGHQRAAVRPPPLVLSALPSLSEAAIPASFDWRNVDGRSLVTADVNQHIPTYCGSCWIHGTIAALNDRIKVARDGQFPDIMLSRQVAMNCVHALDDPEKKKPPAGCHGGDAWAIHSHMVHSPLPDETCQPYEAKNGVCDPSGQCRNCFHPDTVANPATPHVDYTSKGCFAVAPGVMYGVKEYGGLSGEAEMQREIHARGPIVCSFAADATFMMDYQARLVEGVYVDPTYFGAAAANHTRAEVDHDIEVTGWGVTPGGLPYWVARNSWGTYWGERGWFKVLRGANHLFIEDDCAWAVPDLSAFDANVAAREVGAYVTGEQRQMADESSAAQVKAHAVAAVAAASHAAAQHAAAKADAHAIKGKAAEAKLVEQAGAKEERAEAKAAAKAAQPRPSAAALMSLAALDPRRAAPQPAPKGAQPAEYTLLSPAALAAIDPRRPADPEAEEVAEAEAADPDLHWSLGSFGRAAACALVGLAGVAAWRATAFSRRARAVEGEAVRAEWEVAEAIYKPM